VISVAIQTFKGMRIWFALFGFKSQRVCFGVSLATPYKLMMMFCFI